MKRQSPSILLVQPNLRRLLLLCTVALVLLAFVRPALAQDAAEGKTADMPKASVVVANVAASSGLEANLGTAELASSQSSASCPFIKCWITCDNGPLGRTQYFTSAFACFSYSDGGCHAAGFFVCSDNPGGVGC